MAVVVTINILTIVPGDVFMGFSLRGHVGGQGHARGGGAGGGGVKRHSLAWAFVGMHF